MKQILSLAWVLVCLCIFTSAYGQYPLGNHYQYKGTYDDNFRAATVSFNGHYYIVGNTKTGRGQNATWRMVVCKMGVNGSKLWSKTIHIPGLSGASVIGTDIQAGYANPVPSDDSFRAGDNDPDPPGPMANPVSDQNTFDYMYISGTVIRSNGSKSMLIVKIDASANVLWARYDFNSNLSNVDESGVSIESCPNGGAFLVGHTVYNTTAVSCVTIARFNAIGDLRWLNRYTDANYLETEGNFIPHQSCVYEEKVLTSPTAIAVTGEYSGPASNRTRTFVMRVNHAGIENWRAICPSGVVEQPENDTLYDRGWDIIPDPNTIQVGQQTTIPNFVVTGEIGSSSTSTRYMYMFTISISGGYDKGYKIYTKKDSKSLRIWGTSIAESINNTDVAILGYSDEKSTGSNKRNILLEISPINGVIKWSRIFNESEPENTEHITQSWRSGYIISTTESGSGKDGMVFYTEQIGRINHTCEDDTLVCDTMRIGSSSTLGYERIQDTFQVSVSPVTTDVTPEKDSCIFLIDPPFNCNDCISTPSVSICCCEEDGLTKNKVCLRFDTTSCIMRNWEVQVSFEDYSQWVTFMPGNNVVCHTYMNPGTYLILYQIRGEFFANGFWRPCVSTVETATINIPACDYVPMGYLPCDSITCTPLKPGFTSISEPGNDSYKTEIYPNPTDGHTTATVSISLPQKDKVSIELVNIEGKVLWSAQKECIAGTTDIEIPVQNLPNGIYPVIIKHSKGRITKKLVVQ